MSSKQRKREIRKCKKLGIFVPYKPRRSREYYSFFNFWVFSLKLQKLPVRRTRKVRVPCEKMLASNRSLELASIRINLRRRRTCLRRSGFPTEGFLSHPKA